MALEQLSTVEPQEACPKGPELMRHETPPWTPTLLWCSTTTATTTTHGPHTPPPLQSRSAKLQEMRAQKEYEELRECTFTPEVNQGPPPVPVGGGDGVG